MNWNTLSTPWFSLDTNTKVALSGPLSAAASKTPPVTYKPEQWNALLTVQSAYAKSQHTQYHINLYQVLKASPANSHEWLLRHLALWGELDGALSSLHSALDNLAHATCLLQPPQSSNYWPPSFLKLFDSAGTLKSNWSGIVTSQIKALLQDIYAAGGKACADTNNQSKHRRLNIREDIPSAFANSPLFAPWVSQQEVLVIDNFYGQIKQWAESILPLFWQCLAAEWDTLATLYGL